VRRLQGALLEECAEWVWEQLQEEGFFLAGELVELILVTERELGIHARDLPVIAGIVDDEFRMRGIGGSPAPIDRAIIRAVLEWEDEFLGLAGIRRADS
jgi:hypothetical protein